MKKTAVKRLLFMMITVLGISILSGCHTQEAMSAVNEPKTAVEASKQLQAETMAVLESAQISTLNPDVTKVAAPQFTNVEEIVYVAGSQVNVRAGSSTSAQVIKKLDKGVELKRIGFSEQWSKVIYEGSECYISSQYVTTIKPEIPLAVQPVLSGTGSGKIIAIDAGHQTKGMSDKEPNGPGSSVMKAKVTSGATGVSTGLTEYKLNLAVSLKLKEELLARGYQVFMIRETNDVTLSNVDRAVLANESGADIFVRVHANSLNDSSVRGTLTMCMTKNNPYYPNLYGKSSALSKLITDAVCTTTGFRNRGVQETDTMTGINWCSIPSTIVEMGFMSNAEEDQLMATEEYQKKIANGIADGIDAYYSQGN